MTKTMLHQEWAMTLDQAIEAEAQAQAICMQTQDFRRAYEAFAAKQRPQFRGRLRWSPSNTPTPTARWHPPDRPTWALPFFDDAHRTLANGLVEWAREQRVDETDDRAACRDWVRRLGAAGWLRYCVPAAHGGALPALDSRALVILRETLAYHSPLADFAFAMQGLGSGAITLAGTARHSRRPTCRRWRGAKRSRPSP
jgi:alkylation response protein AidB-like acyl-CoA dehydrogenase